MLNGLSLLAHGLSSVSTCGLSFTAFRQQTQILFKRSYFNGLTNTTGYQFNSASLLCVKQSLSTRTSIVTATRHFATGDDKSEDNTSHSELKGVVVHVPNPFLWMKNKWYSYLIRFSVDPAFNLEEFLTGAKQALSFLTRLIVQKDFDSLTSVASVEVVETVRRLVAPWTVEQQHSIEVLVEDITFANASIAAINKDKDSHSVAVDVLCIAVKRFKSKPLLVQMTVRFKREYGKNTASDWFISNINEFVVREIAGAITLVYYLCMK